MMAMLRTLTGRTRAGGSQGRIIATAAAISATPSTLFTVSIHAPDRGRRSEVAPRMKKSNPIPIA